MNKNYLEFFVTFLCLFIGFTFSFYSSLNLTPYLLITNLSDYSYSLLDYPKIVLLNCHYNSSKSKFVFNDSVNISNLTNVLLLFNPNVLNETLINSFLNFVNESLKNISVDGVGLYYHTGVLINLSNFFKNLSMFSNYTFLFLNISSLNEILDNVTTFNEITNKTFVFLRECNDKIYEYFLNLPGKVVLGCKQSNKLLEILRLNEKFEEFIISIEDYNKTKIYIEDRFVNTSNQSPLVLISKTNRSIDVSYDIFSYVQPYNINIFKYDTSFLILIKDSKNLNISFSGKIYYKSFLNYSINKVFDVVIVNSSNIVLKNISYLNKTLSLLLINSRNVTLEGLDVAYLNLTLINSSITVDSTVKINFIKSRNSTILFNNFYFLANGKEYIYLDNSTLEGSLLSIIVNSTNNFIYLNTSRINSFVYVKFLKNNNFSCENVSEGCKVVKYNESIVFLNFSKESNYFKIISILVNDSKIYNLNLVKVIPVFSFNESELKKVGENYTIGAFLNKFSDINVSSIFIFTNNDTLSSYYLNKNYTNVYLVYFNPNENCNGDLLMFYYDYILCKNHSLLMSYKNFSLGSFFEVIYNSYIGNSSYPIEVYFFDKILNNSVILSNNTIKINEPISVEANTGGVGNLNISLILNSNVILISNESIPVFNVSSSSVTINCKGYSIYVVGNFSSLFSISNPFIRFENCSSSIYFFGSKEIEFALSGRIGEDVKFVGFNFILSNLTQEGTLILENSSLKIYNSDFTNLNIINSIAYIKSSNLTLSNITFENSSIILDNLSNITFENITFKNSNIYFQNNISNISFFNVKYFNSSNILENFRIIHPVTFKDIIFLGGNKIAFKININNLVESYNDTPLIRFEKELEVKDDVKLFSIKGNLDLVNNLNSSLIEFKNIDIISVLPSVNYFWIEKDNRRYYYLQFFNEKGEPLYIQTYELGSKEISSEKTSSEGSSSSESSSGGSVSSAVSVTYETVERESLITPEIFEGKEEINVSFPLRVYFYSSEENKKTKIKVFNVEDLVNYLKDKGYDVISVCINLKRYCDYVYFNYNLRNISKCNFCFENFKDYGYLKLRKFTRVKVDELINIEVKVKKLVKKTIKNITNKTTSYINISNTTYKKLNESINESLSVSNKTTQKKFKFPIVFVVICLGIILVAVLWWMYLVPDYEKYIIIGKVKSRLEDLRFKLYNFFARKWR